MLRKARDCLIDLHSTALQVSSGAAIRRFCGALSSITVLLSAASPSIAKGTLHPLFAAYVREMPKIESLKCELSVSRQEIVPFRREDLLTWPSLSPSQQYSGPTAAQFQRDYIDIIPEAWIAISLSLNEDCNELYITLYRQGQSPFILRLPMARHKSRDMDEDVFDFQEGKSELREIIELSNFSTHDARDLSIKGAKTEWWAEREALDARLHDLLVNIENIWLGGFRGALSQQVRQPDLLARFQKSFQKILNRYLPSRQGKGMPKQLNFDPRVLELFTGLGDPHDESVELDEHLTDLLYFIVDVLQFNGERNAYDEIDFDSLVVETLDALKVYHSSVQAIPTAAQHTILILDKNLHAFPWESLPCLTGLSVSRLPSMEALRTRILAARNTQP
ncbi:hypothetical protein LTS18_014634, partial [Coniosporium uncinatum]